MPRSLARPLAVLSVVAVAALALTGCTHAPAGRSGDCSGVLSKVLLTDDSGTTVSTFESGDVPKIFAVPGAPAPTCYYTSVQTPPPVNGVVYTETHRTLLYIGLSDADVQTVIATLRKTIAVAPWTVRFDYGTTPPAAGSTASPTAEASTSSSARWYYNFNGKVTDDKGEMGYYASTPITQGQAIQAGLSKAVNVLRVETELRQVKK